MTKINKKRPGLAHFLSDVSELIKRGTNRTNRVVVLDNLPVVKVGYSCSVRV